MGIKLTARHSGSGADSPPFLEKSFRQNRITVGNHPHANLRLNGSVVAAEQVVIIDGMVEPIIINRVPGTSLNGETLAEDERRSLRDGDLLAIGTYLINVFVYDEPSTPEAQDDFAPGNDNNLVSTQESLLSPDPVTTSPPEPIQTDPFLSELDQKEVPVKSFAAILDGLRTDEDRFYFLIEGGRQAGLRVPIEREEMPLGRLLDGEQLSFDVSSIAELLAIVRKDWSGVILQPQASGLAVNGQVLTDERRMRDGDRVSFSTHASKAEAANGPVLVFHEPASLVILDSLMSKPVPHEIDPSQLSQQNDKVQPPGRVHNSARQVVALFRDNKEYFGAFTFVELSLMAMGTIVGAVIIFLILNYS
jgi:hypothetical protein